MYQNEILVHSGAVKSNLKAGERRLISSTAKAAIENM